MEVIKELTQVFELATNATKFTKNNKKQDGDDAQIRSSEDYAQIRSSEDYAKIGSSGYSAQIGSSGYYAQIGSFGSSAQIGSSGDSIKIGSSGDSIKIGSSGDSTKIGSSGDYAQIGSSGDSTKIGSSGDYAQIGSSGDSTKIGSSGDYAQIGSSGDSTVICSIGKNSVVRAKKGTWITLAEYDNKGKVLFVKTAQVDGDKIKEDTAYCLYNKEFREVINIDGLLSVIINQRGNIIKTKILNNSKESYIYQKDGINAHGKTVKQAYRDWLFKTSPRDMSQYKNLKKDDVKDLNYWVICYRAITGACSFGTENFLEKSKKIKDKMTLEEVIRVTNGKYGHSTFVSFFGK